jgi:hypothetical protein
MEVKGMSIRATATFEIKTWDEKPLNEVEGLPKLTRVSATRSFTGNIEGEGTAEYLMMYRDDSSASFVGLERVIGRVDNRRGSFVFQHSGDFEGGTAKATLLVIAGSGSGDLRGLRGEGNFVATSSSASITLDYDLASPDLGTRK